MAKAAFFSVPNFGHIYPTLPVVAGLVRQGEHVVYYGRREFESHITGTGAEFRTFGDGPFPHDPTRPKPVVQLGVAMLEFTLRVLPTLLEEIRREKYDYVLHDCLCPWGRFAARILGLPAVSSVCLVPMVPHVLRRYMRRSAFLKQALRGAPAYLRFRRLAAALERQYGVPRLGVLDVLNNYSDLNLVYTAREFVPEAERFDASFRFVGPPLPEQEPVGDFPLARLDGRDVIYVALGTARSQAPEFFRACMTAFADRPELVVMSTGGRLAPESLGPPPANFIVRNWVPQLEVLRRSRVHVTHGGMNTCNQALWFGVPMVVWPKAPDLVIQARRIEELGLGRVLWSHRVRPGEIRRLTLEVMADAQVRAAVGAMQKCLHAAGGRDRAVQEILSMVSSVSRPAAPPAEGGPDCVATG